MGAYSRWGSVHAWFETLGILTCLQMASCGSTIVPVREPKKQCEIQNITLSVIASDTINPSPEGSARPVVLRVYQLKDEIAFVNATYEDVWRKDQQELGASLVVRGETYAYPNTRTEIAFQRNPEADSLVIAALFRDYQGKSWFISFELPPAPGKGDCHIEGCEGDSCGIDFNPRYAVWLDDIRVEEGSQHLQDVTEQHRVRVVQLGKTAPQAPPKGDASKP